MALKPITGKPASTPFLAASLIPSSMASWYLLGMTPPVMRHSKPYSLAGSSLSHTSPYWPCPPVCFLYLP